MSNLKNIALAVGGRVVEAKTKTKVSGSNKLQQISDDAAERALRNAVVLPRLKAPIGNIEFESGMRVDHGYLEAYATITLISGYRFHGSSKVDMIIQPDGASLSTISGEGALLAKTGTKTTDGFQALVNKAIAIITKQAKRDK